MRAATSTMLAYLGAVRAGTQALLMADCYTFTLLDGTVLTYGDKDVPLTVGNTVFAANSLRVSGAAYKCSVGLTVDQQELDIIALPTDLVQGVPFLQALRNGAFDGCEIQRDRAFFTSWSAAAVGSITLFKGRLATVDELGRTMAKVTVYSDLTLLDLQMPRNFYQPQCNHALYDAGCGLTKASYGVAGVVGAGSTETTILWAGAAPTFVQGTISFTSGLNTGITASIKSMVNGVSLGLLLPLETAPATGDTFTAYPGCDHSMGSGGCGKFNNLQNYRGFPFIPPPSTTYSG